MCGLSGYSGSVLANPDKLKLLMWDNISRGRQSCGVFGVGQKAFKSAVDPEDFIMKDAFVRQTKSKTVIMHNRAPSPGMSTKEDATHPFIVGNKKNYLVGAHNGTLIPESFEQIKKKIEESKLIEGAAPEVDSLALYQYLYINKFDWKALNDIVGHMALTWVNKEILYLYRREHRPLFLAFPKKGQMYYSSRQEGLIKAGFNTSDIEELEPHVLMAFKDGKLIEEVNLGSPILTLEDCYARNWRGKTDKKVEEENKIFPPKKSETYSSKSTRSHWDNRGSHQGGSHGVTRSGFTQNGALSNFSKPNWMPNHEGKEGYLDGRPAFFVTLNKDDYNVVVGDDDMSKMQAEINLQVRVDQNGRLKKLQNADIVLLNPGHQERANFSFKGGIREASKIAKSKNFYQTNVQGKYSALITGTKLINRFCFIFIENPSVPGMYYIIDLGSLRGGKRVSVTATIPSYQQDDEEKGSYKLEVKEDKPRFIQVDSQEENRKRIEELWAINSDLDSEQESAIFHNPNSEEERVIESAMLLTEEAWVEHVKERWGEDVEINQKKMLGANKAEVLKAFDEKISEGKRIANRLLKNTDDESKAAMVFIEEQIEQMESDKKIFELEYEE